MEEPIQVERVSPSLIRVPLRTATLPPATRTNSYVLRDAGLWIVDPGSSRRRQLKRLLEVLEREPEGIIGLRGYLVTHHHRDHWGGLRWLLRRRDAPVICHDETRLDLDGAHFRPPAWLAQRAPKTTLLHAPGHAADHLVVLTAERDLVAGDVVAGVGTVVIDPPDGSMADYFATLRRLLALSPRRIFPAHGPTIEDGPAKLREYLDHRTMREQQVLDGLRRSGPATPAQLVPHIYQDVPIWAHPLAARSVLAHLIKLRDEGRAQPDSAKLTKARWALTTEGAER
jgi:glyoxylase-like metal-dependent hydrolase (beta-lactamase superfamily II)